MQLVFDDVRVRGSLTGSAIENEDNLRFAVSQDVRAMTEPRPLDDAAAAYDRMARGDARFRVVLTV
jgi:propanol-preferring alcohol dehydrogenase